MSASRGSLEGCPKTAILVGAGNRGHIYATYATHCPNQLKVHLLQSNLHKEPPLGVAKLAVIHRWLSYQGSNRNVNVEVSLYSLNPVKTTGHRKNKTDV